MRWNENKYAVCHRRPEQKFAGPSRPEMRVHYYLIIIIIIIIIIINTQNTKTPTAAG